MAKLKPCPFCNSAARIVPHSFYAEEIGRFVTERYGVECIICKSQTYQFFRTEADAIERWNRRVNDES